MVDELVLLVAAVGVGAVTYLVVGRFLKRKPKSSKKGPIKREEVPREKVPSRIEYEIVRQKDERTVIVKKGNSLWSGLSPRKEFIHTMKRSFFANHIIKETWTDKKGKVHTRYFIRWNLYQSESYDKDGKITFDPALENNLMNDMVIQLRDAVGVVAGLILDKNMQLILVFAMVFGIPIGLSYNDIFHWVPNTVVHWVPRR